MSLVLKGKVIEIGDEWENDTKSFKKRELVLEFEPGDFVQELPIEVVNKRLDILNGVAVGDEVEVEINLRGNKWNDKRYLSGNAWKLNVLTKGDGVPDDVGADLQGGSGDPDPIGPPIEDDLDF